MGTIIAGNWKSHVLERLAQLDWDRLVDDVQRFLLDQGELVAFRKETIEHLLTGSPSA
jgi:hypothetical protein